MFYKLKQIVSNNAQNSSEYTKHLTIHIIQLMSKVHKRERRAIMYASDNIALGRRRVVVRYCKGNRYIEYMIESTSNVPF